MQAMMNIELLNGYEIKRIVTCDPHSFNTIKNEYPSLGGNYDVVHHTQFIKELIDANRLSLEARTFKGKRITFHDPCYLGRYNRVFDPPRFILESIPGLKIKEVDNAKEKSTCCGGGGAQTGQAGERPGVSGPPDAARGCAGPVRILFFATLPPRRRRSNWRRGECD